jgi:hypothetical protein
MIATPRYGFTNACAEAMNTAIRLITPRLRLQISDAMVASAMFKLRGLQTTSPRMTHVNDRRVLQTSRPRGGHCGDELSAGAAQTPRQAVRRHARGRPRRPPYPRCRPRRRLAPLPSQWSSLRDVAGPICLRGGATAWSIPGVPSSDVTPRRDARAAGELLVDRGSDDVSRLATASPVLVLPPVGRETGLEVANPEAPRGLEPPTSLPGFEEVGGELRRHRRYEARRPTVLVRTRRAGARGVCGG